MDIPTSSSLRVSRLLKTANERLLNEAFTLDGIAPENVRICYRSSLPAYGYVNFDSEENAKKAMKALAYKQITDLSDDLLVTFNNRDILNAAQGVFVKGLKSDVTSMKLDEVASKFGPVYTAFAPRANGASLGYGKIIFYNEAGKDACLKTDDETKAILADLGENVSVSEFVPRQERSENFTNILVKNLPADTTEEQYTALLSEFGKVTIIEGSDKPAAPLHTKTFPDGSAAKYGFANFSSHEEAVAAIEGLNQREYHGRVLEATRHHSKTIHAMNTLVERNLASANFRSKYPNCNLLVHNLPKDFTGEQLKKVFSPYGTIVRCGLDAKTPGKAYVLYETTTAGDAAIEYLNGATKVLDMETTSPLQVLRVIKDYPNHAANPTPASFPTATAADSAIFSTTWKEIEATNYQNSFTEEQRITARGNAIYDQVVETVKNATIPESISKLDAEDIASRVTGMIISAKWSPELAEFIAFVEDEAQFTAKVNEGIEILAVANKK